MSLGWIHKETQRQSRSLWYKYDLVFFTLFESKDLSREQMNSSNRTVPKTDNSEIYMCCMKDRGLVIFEVTGLILLKKNTDGITHNTKQYNYWYCFKAASCSCSTLRWIGMCVATTNREKRVSQQKHASMDLMFEPCLCLMETLIAVQLC